MSTPAKKPAGKNKGGRPQRAPGEKLQRVNLSLRPSLLFGLEAVSRDRRTSLSQAAEYLIAQQLGVYKVDGTPILAKLEKVAVAIADLVIDSYSEGEKKPTQEEALDSMRNSLSRTEGGRVILMPEALCTPAEVLFKNLFMEKMQEDSAMAIFLMLGDETLNDLLQTSKDMEVSLLSESERREKFRERFDQLGGASMAKFAEERKLKRRGGDASI